MTKAELEKNFNELDKENLALLKELRRYQMLKLLNEVAAEINNDKWLWSALSFTCEMAGKKLRNIMENGAYVLKAVEE